ncbi:MAG: alpha/beta fold hydrolase [Pirellulaceae bacterium]|nr:alpha/beta fold hydrolase [Pirellulaceae bacterium]
MFFQWLANRTILKPSRTPIAAPDKLRREIPFGSRTLEVWTQAIRSESADSNHVIVLKFPGMSGRAEYSSLSPLDQWTDFSGEVWTINYPGYGASTGPADLRLIPATALAFFDEARRIFPDSKLVVAGTSLGTCPALLVAASRSVDGLILRNPSPIGHLIREHPRYNRWNFGAARFVADCFPEELDPIRNAARVTTPTLFIQSALDQLVPVEFQNRVIEAHRGPQRLFSFPGDHHELPEREQDRAEFHTGLMWLRDELLGTSP